MWLLLLSPGHPGDVTYLPPLGFYAVWLWKVFKCWKFELGCMSDQVDTWGDFSPHTHPNHHHHPLSPSPPSVCERMSTISSVASVFATLHLQRVSGPRPQTDTLKPSRGSGALNDFILFRWKGKMFSSRITNKDQGRVWHFPPLPWRQFRLLLWVIAVWVIVCGALQVSAGVRRNNYSVACAEIRNVYSWITILWA